MCLVTFWKSRRCARRVKAKILSRGSDSGLACLAALRPANSELQARNCDSRRTLRPRARAPMTRTATLLTVAAWLALLFVVHAAGASGDAKCVCFCGATPQLSASVFVPSCARCNTTVCAPSSSACQPSRKTDYVECYSAGFWGDGGWSAWKPCAATCNQTRTCDNPTPRGYGKDCQGPSVQPCVDGKCPHVQGTVFCCSFRCQPALTECCATHSCSRVSQSSQLFAALCVRRRCGQRVVSAALVRAGCRWRVRQRHSQRVVGLRGATLCQTRWLPLLGAPRGACQRSVHAAAIGPLHS